MSFDRLKKLAGIKEEEEDFTVNWDDDPDQAYMWSQPQDYVSKIVNGRESILNPNLKAGDAPERINTIRSLFSNPTNASNKEAGWSDQKQEEWKVIANKVLNLMRVATGNMKVKDFKNEFTPFGEFEKFKDWVLSSKPNAYAPREYFTGAELDKARSIVRILDQANDEEWIFNLFPPNRSFWDTLDLKINDNAKVYSMNSLKKAIEKR